MTIVYLCDICGKKTEDPIRVDLGRGLYCEKCWQDRKNWPIIHKIEKNLTDK